MVGPPASLETSLNFRSNLYRGLRRLVCLENVFSAAAGAGRRRINLSTGKPTHGRHSTNEFAFDHRVGFAGPSAPDSAWTQAGCKSAADCARRHAKLHFDFRLLLLLLSRS